MKNKSKSNEVADKDLEKVSGGSVSKLIFLDGRIEYRANPTEHLRSGELPVGYSEGYNGEPSNIFKKREDAEKYAIERKWGTELYTFEQQDNGHPGKYRYTWKRLDEEGT